MDLGTNMAGFWRGLGGQVGAMLGPNATKAGPKKQSKKSSLFGRPPEPILMNFWWILAPPSWSQDPPKTHSNWFRRPPKECCFFWLIFGSGFGGIWSQHGSNLAAQTPPKSSHVGPKIHQKLDQDVNQFVAWFLIGLGHFFSNFPSKLEGRESPKSLKTYYVFSILATSANLPTRGNMIEYLINLALNLASKIHQKST